MRTALFTGFNAPYTALAKLTTPLMHRYAQVNNIDFFTFEEEDRTAGPPMDWMPLPSRDFPNIYWTGVCGAMFLLGRGWDRVIYLDCDQVITNEYATPWVDLQPAKGFHCSKDWGNDATEPWHFSMCGFVAHLDAMPLLQTVLNEEPDWRDKPFQEQGPFQHVIKQLSPSLRDEVFFIHPRRVFNAVPKQVCPGQVPEPWKPNDWCAHLTMVGIDRRLELFHEVGPLRLR